MRFGVWRSIMAVMKENFLGRLFGHPRAGSTPAKIAEEVAVPESALPYGLWDGKPSLTEHGRLVDVTLFSAAPSLNANSGGSGGD